METTNGVRALPKVRLTDSGRILTVDARLRELRPDDDPGDGIQFDTYPDLLLFVFENTVPAPGDMDADTYAQAMLGPLFPNGQAPRDRGLAITMASQMLS